MKLTVSAIQQTYTLSGRNACALGSHLSLLITLLQPTLFCVGVSCPLISSFAVLILPSPDGERELTIKSYDHNILVMHYLKLVEGLLILLRTPTPLQE